jgi:hypothetical protein
MATVVFPALEGCTIVTGIGARERGCGRLVWTRHAALAVLGEVFGDGRGRNLAVRSRRELFLEMLERV